MPVSSEQPWRRVVRTVFQFTLALAALLVAIGDDLTATFPQLAPYIAAAVGIAAGITRVMLLPQVEAFLEHWVPWLAADESPTGSFWSANKLPGEE